MDEQNLNMEKSDFFSSTQVNSDEEFMKLKQWIWFSVIDIHRSNFDSVKQKIDHHLEKID